MGVAAQAPAAEGVVGKKRLCEELGWSRMRLDRRLEADAAFPVVSRGTQAGGWAFDLAAVRAYLEPEEERELVAEDIETPEGHAARAELTARQRRDLSQAQLYEDKLRRLRGDLVEASDLKLALTEAVSRTGVALNAMAEVLVRRLNLPESALPIIRQEVDGCRRQLVAGLREHLVDG